jgi:hypothetical protein
MNEDNNIVVGERFDMTPEEVIEHCRRSSTQLGGAGTQQNRPTSVGQLFSPACTRRLRRSARASYASGRLTLMSRARTSDMHGGTGD